MATAEVERGSFRDPSGNVRVEKGRVYRTVQNIAADDFEFVRTTGLVDDFVAEGLLVPERTVDPSTVGSWATGARYVLEHPRLPFVSYPYEWSFQALKSAALLHLDLHVRALTKGVTLSDASAYNVQFSGPQPIFIDHLSFRRYRPGEYWAGHGQFCQQFLNPLLLRAYCGVPHNYWFRGAQEGIETEHVARLLPMRKKFLSWNTLTHIVLQARLQRGKGARTRAASATARPLPRSALVNLLRGLRSWIRGLEPADSSSTVWGNYVHEHSYSDDEVVTKRAFVSRFAKALHPELLWDLGCNTGDYSKLALESGARKVIGFDFDQGALDIAFMRARDESLDLFPVFLDATNPSPSQGWAQVERPGLSQRASADGILALALLHHIAIGKNVPLDDAVQWLISLAPAGVIEFVPKSDSMVQELLRLRDDIFPDYELGAFREAVNRSASIVEETTLSRSGRLLAWYVRDR